MILADLGAEVIKIEPPARHNEARRRGPFLNDIPDPEKAASFSISTPTSWASPWISRPAQGEIF